MIPFNHSLIVTHNCIVNLLGAATGLLMLVASYLHSPGARIKPSFQRSVIHFTPIIVFLLALVFAWRAHLVVSVAGKQYSFLLLATMSLSSIFVFISLLIAHAADNDRIRLDKLKTKEK